MNTEQEFAYNLLAELKRKLMPKYSVTPAYASASIEGLSPDSRPDIVVSSKSGKPFLIEIRGLNGDQDLPISTAYVTQILRKANEAIDPRIVLITKSKIGKLLYSELKLQGVSVLNASDFREMTSQLVDIIEEPKKYKDLNFAP